MALAIVTDSNISLPKHVFENLPIFIAPLEIYFDGCSYIDGVDLNAEEFYRIISTQKKAITTSAPKPQAFLEAFEKASDQYDEIICISLSSKLSATYTCAQQAIDIAATKLAWVKIKLIDSETAGLAQGLMVLTCARQAQRGESLDSIVKNLQETKDSYSMIGCVGSLDYLVKSGRIPNIYKWISNLANIKPLVQFSSGEIKMVSRHRGISKALNHMVTVAKTSIGDTPAFGAVMHSDDLKNAIRLSDKLRSQIDFQELFITELTPVIGAHVGNGLVGCAFSPISKH